MEPPRHCMVRATSTPRLQVHHDGGNKAGSRESRHVSVVGALNKTSASIYLALPSLDPSPNPSNSTIEILQAAALD